MEQNQLSIAVIIPAYNVAPYIMEAVKSVLEQPYPYITIVCVNDGSTDNTLDVLQELSQENSRIVLLDQPNGGVSVARNNGIEYVLSNLSADYIMFLDGDDIWYKNWCSPEAIKILSTGYDMVLFDYCHADFRTKMRGPSLHTYTGIVEGGDFAVNIDHQSFAASAYKCDMIRQNGIRFHRGQKLGEDIQFALEARSLSQKCCFVEQLILIYRNRPDSATKKEISPIVYYTQLFDGWIQSHAFLKKHGFESKCTYGAIKWYLKDLVQSHFRQHGTRKKLETVLQRYSDCLDVDGPEEQKAHLYLEQFDRKYELKQRLIGSLIKVVGIFNRIPPLRHMKDKRRYPIPLER